MSGIPEIPPSGKTPEGGLPALPPKPPIPSAEKTHKIGKKVLGQDQPPQGRQRSGAISGKVPQEIRTPIKMADDLIHAALGKFRDVGHSGQELISLIKNELKWKQAMVKAGFYTYEADFISSFLVNQIQQFVKSKKEESITGNQLLNYLKNNQVVEELKSGLKRAGLKLDRPVEKTAEQFLSFVSPKNLHLDAIARVINEIGDRFTF